MWPHKYQTVREENHKASQNIAYLLIFFENLVLHIMHQILINNYIPEMLSLLWDAQPCT